MYKQKIVGNMRALFILVFVFGLSGLAMAQNIAPEDILKIPVKPEYGTGDVKSLEELSSTRPSEKFASKRTDNVTISMLFHKITGQIPDFTEWARNSKSYQNAPDAQKAAVLNNVSDKLKTKFNLMSFNEPIHIEQLVTLRQYRPDAEGVFIDDFNPKTFFTYGFNGEYFAVIPADLMDYEYLKIAPEKMKTLGEHITPKNQLFMRLTLVPTRGDAKSKVRLSNGHENWLLAANVMDIELWSPTDTSLLWRSNEDFYNRKNQLLNLYQ